MGADLKSDLEFGSWNQTKNALIRVKSWMSGIKICKSNPYIVMLSKVKISEIIWLSIPRLPRFLSGTCGAIITPQVWITSLSYNQS